MQFDHESNILTWEISKDPISHAVEFGNFIIHLSKNKKPVLIEILDASKFIGQMDKLKKQNLNKLALEAN
jgi:hypothetical protein